MALQTVRALRRFLRLPSRSAARIQRDIDEELRLHLDMRIEELERMGMSPAEARRQAMRKFGDLEDATRYCAAVDQDLERRRRTTGWLSELRQDVLHTLRVLRRGPAFTAATVLTLGVAAGASTTVYGILHTYLFRPLPFPESDRLVSILDAPSFDGPRGPSLRDVDWRRIEPLFDATAAWDLDGFTLTGGEYAENVVGAWVSAGYFKALRIRPALGRLFRAEEYREQTPVAIISHDLWVKRFGADSGVIGKTITAHSTDRPNAATVVTIVGVTRRDFWPIHWRESDLLRPLPSGEAWVPALARLKAGASSSETQRRVDAAVRAQITEQIDPAWHMTLTPFLDRYSARVRPLVLAIFGAAVFMLVAACGSVAGTLVSRTAARRSELTIRLALGAHRSRLVRQLLTESAVLATLAGIVGVGIAYILLGVTGPFVESQLGTKVPGGVASLRPTPALMTMVVLASAAAGVVLGLLPALTFLRLGRSATTYAALGAGRSSATRGTGAVTRKVLVAAQVAVAMVLMFGAGLMFRTVANMATTNPGVQVDGVLTATVLLPDSRYPDSTAKRLVMQRMLAGIARTAGVRSVAAVYPKPFSGAWRFPVFAEGLALDEQSAPRTALYTVSPSYFETMGVRLHTGRTFRQSDDAGSPLVVVVSESLAERLAPRGGIIGRRIKVRVPYLASFDDEDRLPWRTVIGVVTDTKKGYVSDAPTDVYVPYTQNPRSLQSIVMRTDRHEASMVDPVRRSAAAIDPSLALSGIESMTDIIADEGGQRRGLTGLLGAFAAFALGLSALALYASLSYAVVQRRSELAIRMAIGASARSILRVVVGEGLATAAVGIGVGAVASLALGRVLANQLYGVGATDPATLVVIATVLALAVIAASTVPALRAARTDPALALRE